MTGEPSRDWATRTADVERPAEDARRVYDRRARSYDLLEAPFERRARAAGLRLLAAMSGERILEIGCGTGHTVAALAPRIGPAGRLIGVDLSAAMLAVARTRVRRRGAERVVFLQADARSIPLDDSCVDAVTTSFTLDLIGTGDIPVVLDECRRVLRPDGRICAVSLDLVAHPPLATRLYLAAHHRWPRLVDCRPLPLADVLIDNGYDIRDRWTSSIFGIPVTAVIAAKQDAPHLADDAGTGLTVQRD